MHAFIRSATSKKKKKLENILTAAIFWTGGGKNPLCSAADVVKGESGAAVFPVMNDRTLMYIITEKGARILRVVNPRLIPAM